MNRCTKPRLGELVGVRWDIPEDRPPIEGEAVERLMHEAIANGVVREWDDGRGRCLWYNARRGQDERRLRAAIVKACGEEPVEVRPSGVEKKESE